MEFGQQDDGVGESNAPAFSAAYFTAVRCCVIGRAGNTAAVVAMALPMKDERARVLRSFLPQGVCCFPANGPEFRPGHGQCHVPDEEMKVKVIQVLCRLEVVVRLIVSNALEVHLCCIFTGGGCLTVALELGEMTVNCLLSVEAVGERGCCVKQRSTSVC